MKSALSSCLLFGLCLAAAAQSGIPELISYQGRLVDGTNLVNGTRAFRFSFHDSSLGGQELYKELQTLSVQDGLFSTMIGLSNSYPGTLRTVFDSPAIWLELAVDGVTLAPRQQMSAAGYAMTAGRVGGGAITTGMLADSAVTSAKLAPASVGPSQLTANVLGLFVNRGGDTMAGPLLLPIDGLSVGTDQLVVAGDRVGVGTVAPGATLELYGSTANLQINNTQETEAGLVMVDSAAVGSQYGRILFDSASPNRLSFYIDSPAPLVTLADDQQVGIGVTNPASKLHVEGAGTAAGGVVGGTPEVVAYFRNTLASRHSSIALDGQPGFDAALYLAENGTAVWDVRHDASDANKLNFRYHGGGANATRMLVTPEGNVGVGVASPSERLDVGGNVETTGSYRYAPARIYDKNCPPQAFVLQSNDGGDAEYEIDDYTGALKITSTSVSQHLYLSANVDLPQGAVVQELKAYYYDNAPSAALWAGAQLSRKYLLDDLPLQELANVPYAGTSSDSDTYQTRSDTSIANGTIDNENYMYLLYLHYAVSSANSGLAFAGVQVRYSLQTVAP